MEPAAVDEADLHCPLCEYNLRGLTDPRCPECGFAFTWDELRAADRNRHPWLFEHARRLRLWSLWTTWRRNRWPHRFWHEVTPANAVDVRRLVVYWAVVAGLSAVTFWLPLPHGYFTSGRGALVYNGMLPGVPTYVTPSGLDVLADLSNRTMLAVREETFSPDVIGPPLLVLAWPWLSFAALMLFQWSMRKAKILPAHVLRTAVYGCDLGPVVLLAVVAFMPVTSFGWRFLRVPNGVPLAYVAMFCGGWATIRLSVAYARYLRFHLPVATVVAAQLVVVAVVLTALTLTTDLGDLFR